MVKLDLLWMEERENAQPQALREDLKLEPVLMAMAGDDRHLYRVCEWVLTRPLTQICRIQRRSALLRRFKHCSEWVEEVYAIAREAVEEGERLRAIARPRYGRNLPNSKRVISETELAQHYLGQLKRLRSAFSEGPGGLGEELEALRGAVCHATPEELERLCGQLDGLRGQKVAAGVCLSAHLGRALKPAGVVLNALDTHERRRRFWEKPAGELLPLNGLVLVQNAEEMAEAALGGVCRELEAFTQTLGALFQALYDQLPFYLGSLRLLSALEDQGVALCAPEWGERYAFAGLVDASLALKQRAMPVENEADLTGVRHLILTGRNQGGKTTFLRSVGVGQLMAQCGLPVAARGYCCPCFSGIFTHFPNGEDGQLNSGLLEVELKKLSDVVDALRPGGLLLLNESFQTTAELDATELALEILPALEEAGVTVLFVTHLYAYAARRWSVREAHTKFLSPTGPEGFRLAETRPQPSAQGVRLFEQMLAGLSKAPSLEERPGAGD